MFDHAIMTLQHRINTLDDLRQGVTGSVMDSILRQQDQCKLALELLVELDKAPELFVQLVQVYKLEKSG